MAVLAGAIYVFTILVPHTDARQNAVKDHAPYTISAPARALHNTLYIADMHTDSLLWRRDPAKRWDRGHADIPRLREGGVNFQIFSAVTKSPRGLNFDGNRADAPDDIALLVKAQLWPLRTWNSLYERAAYQAERLHKLESDPEHNLIIARRAADLEQPAGTLVTLLLIEGAHPLEGDIENIARLYAAGYRAMGLQHFFDNALGGSKHGVDKSGLTEFGSRAVLEMHRQGLIIDVAHSSDAVVRDVLALIEGPIFISHGGTVSHCPHTANRNLPDDILKRIAARGGILGVGYFEGAICDSSPAGIAAAITDAITLLGPDAVALGSDFDGGVTTTLDTSELAAITQALLESGMETALIRKVMGENARRFFADNLPQ